MINSILVEPKLTSDFVKFTVTRNNDLRIKVPIDTTQADIEVWTTVGINLFNSIAPVDRSYRGKVRIGESHVSMYNDAKTHSIAVELKFEDNASQANQVEAAD
jgi:hypothetical protein